MSAGPIDAAGVNKLLRTTDNWILTGSTMFRRECVTWAGGFDARLGSFADGFIALKIALRYGFYIEPKIIANWVVFPDNVSRTEFDHPAYDCSYLALAVETECSFVTADERFLRKLHQGLQPKLRGRAISLIEAVSKYMVVIKLRILTRHQQTRPA